MTHDIVGDIHGQAEKLKALLKKLGYRETMGAWRHPDRKAMFVGDLIDRGPGQLETLDIVRRMIDAGSARAVLGNHELNGIAFGTQDPDRPKHFLRIRGTKNKGQHQAFLTEVGLDSPLHKEWINWFMTLPLWIETDELRLVHACWHPQSMAAIADQLGPNNTLTPELLVASCRKNSAEFNAVEAICKGLELDLPQDVTFTDKQGIVRNRTRIKWWDEKANTYRSAALIGPTASQLPEDLIPEEVRTTYDQVKPVFFGHYWMTGNPSILSDKTCCVDYSAARDSEPLVAYRYDGEKTLSNEKLIAVLPGADPVREFHAEELVGLDNTSAAVRRRSPSL